MFEGKTLGDASTLMSCQLYDHATLLRSIADMKWFIRSIEIEAIKRGVLSQPQGNLIAVFPWVYQVNSSPLPRTDKSPLFVEFTG
ncbi:hypothetical protein DBR19_21430 [Aeromonas sp. HMWF014]|nr:hypothetical protein DBR19_21430 [Aeromonas sp. HMWF014]